MRSAVITVLIWLAATTTAAADGSPGSKASPDTSPKPKPSEVSELANDLEGRTDKLRNLMEGYRSLVAQRPQGARKGPDARRSQQAQLARWESAVNRLMRRIKLGHAEVLELSQRLGAMLKSDLATSLAKHAANAFNDAEAVRAAAEQALAKHRPAPPRKDKRARPTPLPEQAPPPLDLDDPNL